MQVWKSDLTNAEITHLHETNERMITTPYPCVASEVLAKRAFMRLTILEPKYTYFYVHVFHLRKHHIQIT